MHIQLKPWLVGHSTWSHYTSKTSGQPVATDNQIKPITERNFDSQSVHKRVDDCSLTDRPVVADGLQLISIKTPYKPSRKNLACDTGRLSDTIGSHFPITEMNPNRVIVENDNLYTSRRPSAKITRPLTTI